MLQASGDANLALKALGPEARGELRVQHLERDGPAVAQILGEKHRGHATATELALDRVIRQADAKLFQQVAQITPASSKVTQRNTIAEPTIRGRARLLLPLAAASHIRWDSHPSWCRGASRAAAAVVQRHL